MESSSSVILHRKRVNKVFGKRSSRLLACFIKFFTTARLPLRQSHAEGRCLQHKLRQADHRLHLVVVVKEPQVTYGSCSQIMSYIFNMLICVDMIMLDNLL
jgi:2-keto-4-pentenoate hydratase/2-oxohepta-3-ene-1,7-dioic acid hydratase in catechol pathway